MTAALDHLVVAARTLPEGVAWLEGRLGVPLQPGGEHPLFGTHNALLTLGGGAYLEVIAVNPDAPAPARPRWFALDTPDLRARLAERPRLIHWVAQVPQLQPEWASLHGDPLALARGTLTWTLTVPPDGRLPLGGVLPSLIAWAGAHPTDRLPDAGVRLEALTLTSPDAEALRAHLGALGLGAAATIQAGRAPALTATLRTPAGTVTLD
ncbi:VOC family protein [Deinococcus maricopensis]|uniref:Glyoxalase-like domain-containing protein n=1 Tax=Deinococcus maricopensis (strain DSM 21211 / LMG 22137 / NRRL B-23946 / LB-34) TaxID=709986 RepID=E8U656_DEIML|nr:VOC family protein [Deinococcus maricopensis]ADV66545.1 hypothetical protein Deima_0891 [Deinococcus maricopensis DSM 21211]